MYKKTGNPIGRPPTYPPLKPGEVFGDLTVLRMCERAPAIRHRSALCRCICGTEKIIATHALRSGHAVSCGCGHARRCRHLFSTHGLSKTREYRVWAGMKSRCQRPTDPAFHDYGARGIGVCDRWLESFENFFADMGECPAEHSLERIDNDKGYSPQNCVWADRIAQNRNKRSNTVITMNGETRCLQDWSELYGIKPATVCTRVHRHGWSIERALTTPVCRSKSSVYRNADA